MAYRTSKDKLELFIGNGTLVLTREAMRAISDLIDGDEDVFDFISEAVNHYVAVDTQRLGRIEQMLQELIDGGVSVAPAAPTKAEDPSPKKPEVKISATAGNVDLMKALQNMKNFTR